VHALPGDTFAKCADIITPVQLIALRGRDTLSLVLICVTVVCIAVGLLLLFC
jgi:hypothetical protein